MKEKKEKERKRKRERKRERNRERERERDAKGFKCNEVVSLPHTQRQRKSDRHRQ